jgi:hypothetical protein
MSTKHEEFGTANINGLQLRLSMPSMLAIIALGCMYVTFRKHMVI